MRLNVKKVVAGVGLCAGFVWAPSFMEASTDETMVKVNLLNDKQGESSFVDVEVTELPIIEELQVNIPSNARKANDNEEETSIEEGAEGESHSLVDVDMSSSLTGDVEVDVITSDVKSDTATKGLVEVQAEDLPVVGDVHAGVLDKHVEKDAEGLSGSTGVVQADVDGELLEDTSVNVLAQEHGSSATSEANSAAVADIHVGGGIIESAVNDATVSVLKEESSATENSTSAKHSLASVAVSTPLTEAVAVDVASKEVAIDEEGTSFDGGLVEVNVEELPLVGETHIGVLDQHLETTKEGLTSSSGVLQVDVDGELLEETSIGVLDQDVNMDEEGFTSSSGVIQVDVGGGLLEDTSVGLLEHHLSLSEEGKFSSSAVLDVNVGGVLLDDTSLSLLDHQLAGTNDGYVSLGKVVGIQLGSSQVGSISVDLLPSFGFIGSSDASQPDDEEDTNGDTDEGNGGTSVDGNGNDDVGTEMPGDSSDSTNGNGDTNTNGNGDGDTSTDGTINDDTGINGGVNNVGPTEDAATTPPTNGNDNGNGSTNGVVAGAHGNASGQTPWSNADERSSLPTTGGLLDGKRIIVIALLLLTMGVGLRYVGKTSPLGQRA